MSSIEGRPARAGKLNGDELVAALHQLEADMIALLDQRDRDAATIQRQKDELTKLASDNQVMATAYEEVRRICERFREENHRLRGAQPADDGYTYYRSEYGWYRQAPGRPLEFFGRIDKEWGRAGRANVEDYPPNFFVRIKVSDLPKAARL